MFQFIKKNKLFKVISFTFGLHLDNIYIAFYKRNTNNANIKKREKRRGKKGEEKRRRRRRKEIQLVIYYRDLSPISLLSEKR